MKDRVDRETTYQVKELAELTGVTVRTLHHYDDIGLLVPAERTSAGYRRYSDDDLLRLQQILLCRELGMALEQIKRLLDDPDFNRQTALEQQLEQLRRRAAATSAMIRSVEAALDSVKGLRDMKPREIFDGFDPEEHEEEAKQRWGSTDAFKESARRTKGYEPEDWKRIQAENEELMEAFAQQLAQGSSAEDEAVLDLAERHRLHVDRWYYPCSHAMHAQLANLYTADARFKAAFDKYGEGLAELLAAAIRGNMNRG